MNNLPQNMDLLAIAQLCRDKFIHLQPSRPNIQAIHACDLSGKQSTVPQEASLICLANAARLSLSLSLSLPLSLQWFTHVQTVFLQLLGLESTTEATGRSLAGSLDLLLTTSRYVSCKIASFTDFAPQKLPAAPSTSSLL